MTVNYPTINQAFISETDRPVLLIPLNFSRHNRTYAFTSMDFLLDDQLNSTIGQSLLNRAKEEALFAAVYLAWLYRMSGESELLIGLVGQDGSGVPVHIDMKSGKTFQSVYESIASSLVMAERFEGDEFETRFAVRRTIKPERELINWQMLESDGRWRIRVEYDTSLFDQETIARYALYYMKLLEAALANAETSIAAVEILTEEDKAVYKRMNATEAEYDEGQTIHGMIEAAAVKYPEKVALSSVHGELTYHQLNEKANQVAYMLLDKGLKNGDFVAIMMERSLELIVSLLGILKAGGAYIPIDLDHPEERNRFIVEDTSSVFVITKTRYLQQAGELISGIASVKEMLNMDSDFELYDGTSNPERGVKQDDLAYIIYTSGSTGRPKGALIAHEGVVNLGEVVRQDCEIRPDDVLTQFATYSFDASVWDTIGALFYGATLYLLSPEERVSVEDFASAVERTGTTIITILPTVFFNQLAAYLSEEGYRKLSKVKLVTVAGEALYGEQVRAFQRKFSDRIDIVNVYGPTECTVCTTTHKISGLIPEDMKNVPIGKPIQNYKVYIVNEENRLCPINVHGEVYISSVGLAKGYLNQPEKTAEAIVPDPFLEGGWIYKSGDIAKLLPDGTIEYVGRRDSQLKILGHRIEIGEIEDSFAKIPNVQNVAVIPKKEKDGQNMLVGYFTSRDSKTVPASIIKRMLGEKLPSYFVPKWIVQLEQIPISPTGKIDRKKLAGYDHREEMAENDGYAAPVNETQAAIAAAWQEGLGLERVGIYDDFFEVGGDSLAVIHILVILKPHFPELKINDFFQYRTIADLSRRIEQLKLEASGVFHSAQADGKISVLEEHPMLVDGWICNAEQPSAVLLTGGTGYLGAHLLYELLVQSQASVYCLVRRSGSASGLSRLRETMIYYFGRSAAELMSGRVFEVTGNLDQPGLGLSKQDRQMLKSKLHAIFHSAADVRHFGDAEKFLKTNIFGTRDLIDLAAECENEVRFHHISTLGIPEELALSGQWEGVVEKQMFEQGVKVDNLYTNSKLEAEKMLYAAARQGLSVSIYRAGNLSCRSDNGIFQKNIDSNAFYRMIKALLLLEKAPEVNGWVDLTPIDYAAKSIVYLALRPDTEGRVFHICNPEQMAYSKLIDMIRNCGYTIETLDADLYAGWLLDKTIVKNTDGVKLAISGLEGEGAKESNYRYGCKATSALLEEANIRCASPDFSFFLKMIDYGVEIGYFPKSIERAGYHVLEAGSGSA